MPKKTKRVPEYEKLVQLESIVIDKNASRKDRLESYLEQVDDPNRFYHKKIKIKLSFSNSGKSLEDCLLHMGRGL